MKPPLTQRPTTMKRTAKSSKVSASVTANVHQILQLVYEEIDRSIWQKAVAIYRDNELTTAELSGELISSEIEDRRSPTGKWQVRFKLHGGGRAIRWFECGCSYARKTGGLCEHLMAVFLMVCREHPQFFSQLNPKAPFAMSSVRGSRQLRSTPPAKQANAMEYVFDLLSQATLNKVTLHPKTGISRISFELRKSFKDLISLSVDETSALLNHPLLSDLYSNEYQQVRLLPLSSGPGWKVCKCDAGEKWLGEKRVFFWVPANDPELLKMMRAAANREEDGAPTITEERTGACLMKKRRFILTDDGLKGYGNDNSDGRFLFSVSREEIASSLGKNKVFVPHLGFMDFHSPKERSLWNKPSHTVAFRGKEIDKLIATEFRSLRTLPTIVHKTWLKESIYEVKITRIDLYDYDGYRFVLDPKYQVAGKLCSVSQLLKLAKDKNRSYIFQNHHWIKVPDLLIDLDFQLSEDGSAFQLDTIALLRWRSLFGSLDQLWHGEEHLIEDLHGQMAFHDTSQDSLDFSHTDLTLRDYQVEGVRWLWWLYKNRLHGLLADDMGLGKTHQTMALLSQILKHEPEQASHPRFLVICPTTVVGHWHEKIDMFAPILKPLRYHGVQREITPGFHTLITSYGVLLRDIEYLCQMEWQVVMCDEAHVIKNPKTSTYWACRRLNAKMRLCLSGTPIENRLYELKTLFDFLLPGYLGSQHFFKKYYEVGDLTPHGGNRKNASEILPPAKQSEPEEDSFEAGSLDAETEAQIQAIEQEALERQRKERENRLKRLIEPLKMRRTKAQVLDDLPEKVEDIRHCRLSPRQKELYQQTLMNERSRSLLDVLHDKSKPLPYLHVFSLLQKLKQICNHPALVTKAPWREESSEKFDLLKELLDESLRSCHKVVIFSQYVKMIEIITDYLDEQKIRHVSLVGHSKNREQLVSRFQNDPSISVFVGSLLAGGVGIDLTAASVVIHYDRWWNASKENQATDRVHRIGQKNSLLVLKLVTLDTIEEKIDQMIEKKQKLFDIFLAQNPAHFKQFSREELIDLVSSDIASLSH